MKLSYSILVLVVFAGCAKTHQCNYPNYIENLAIIKSDTSAKLRIKAIQQLLKEHHIRGFDIKDIYQKSLLLNDEVTLNRLYNYLKVKGVPHSYFYKLWDYEWCIERGASKNSKNSELKIKMIALQRKDQIFNDKYHSWRKGEYEMSKEQLVYEAGEILNQFNEIVNNYGFPSEKNIGYHFVKGEYRDTPNEILLIHIYQRGDRLYFEQLDSLRCSEDISGELFSTLKKIKGMGEHVGYKAEMEIRYNMYK